MIGYIDKIKEISKVLLEDGKVDMVIGFRKGTVPMINEPFAAKTAADVDSFVWDSGCGINLANYLTNRKEKIGIIAKGCDSRNIVNHIIENKINREQLTIIGVPCKGMVDRSKVNALVSYEITAVIEKEDTLIISGSDSEKTLKKSDVLSENCKICKHRNPVIFDELAAKEVDEQKDVNRYEDVDKIEAMDPDKKWNYFEDMFKSCIRCYACRNVCPLCYCPTCFVDEAKPQWVGKSQAPADIWTFHFLRAYHCAGRCTDCGSCVRACPMDINVRLLTKKLEKDCFEMFGWEAGLSVDKRPPLDVFSTKDPDGFIK
jgi:ferredoxin